MNAAVVGSKGEGGRIMTTMSVYSFTMSQTSKTESPCYCLLPALIHFYFHIYIFIFYVFLISVGFGGNRRCLVT